MFTDRFGRKLFEDPNDATTGSSDFGDETYVDDEEYFKESHEYIPHNKEEYINTLRSMVEDIRHHVKKTSKPPTGNQNCQLCAWCTEARIRGFNVLPRPVYSPRDPVLEIKGENIVKNPIVQSLGSGLRSDIENLYDLTDVEYGRWYCHVNWAGSTGGHEFILVRINDTLYVVDSQAGILIDASSKSCTYFTNINWGNSYIARLDNKDFNKDMFIKNNDPSQTLPWDDDKDIAYLIENGMLSDEDIRYLEEEKGISLDKDINEAKVERVNDKGDEVPEKCDKCGSQVGLYLKGEPVWLCSNKKCSKYFGTAPCNFQEATTDNKNKMIPVTDFKFDKVYYGDPIKRTNYMTCDENRPLFTTPYTGLASIFSGRYNIIKILREKGCRMYNLGYDEWGLDLSELKEPLSEVHVRVEGYPNLESFTCTFEGYIHTIDVSNIKHNLYQYPWMSDGREVLIANMKEIPIEKVEKVKVTYIVSGAESRNTFQEGVLNDLKNGVNPYSPTAVCEDMVRNLKRYNYGIPVNGKVQNIPSSEYFNKHYKLLSPDEFEKYGGGICWDYVEFMEGYLDAYGYTCKKYYISTDTKDNDTHTFIIVDDGEGGLLYPESSFKLLEGLHKVKSVEEAIKMITSKMFEMNNNSKKYSKIKYYVWEYTGHPEYGSDCKQCTEYFSKGEPFYEGIAKNDKYVKEGYRMSSYPSRFETYDEVVQEGMFDAGFNSLRFRLAKELGERFKVSNIMRAMGGANDKFVVSLVDDDSKRADVVNMGNGVKVPGIFNNMSLSGAFRRLVEFFKSPEFLTEYVSPVDENEYIMESDDDTSPERMTVDDGDSIDLNVDINIDDFGSDTGSTQNDYDPTEVEELNRLIASEASAMGEYLSAAKTTNVDVLRRLYSDICDEERFHTEQLLFAKASITGEPYEPRDPEVKKEYEELLAMGMDEETALNTAIDKRIIIGNDEGPDIEDLDDDIVATESAINQCVAAIDLMDIIFESTDEYSSESVDKCIGIFAEAFCESSMDTDVFSEAVMDPSEYKTPNPFVLIFRGWIALCKFIKQLVKNITIFVNKIMQKQAVRNAWVNEHGIEALFKSGVSLYFYEEKYSNGVSGEPILYAEFLLYLTRMIASSIGCTIKCDNIHNTLINDLRSAGFHPIRVNSIEEGIDKINRITLMKTKVVVDKHNQNELISLFIGYGRNGGDTIYDMMSKVAKVVDNVASYENDFINWLKNSQGIQDSIYYTNRNGYNTAMSQIKVVNKGFGIFVKALAHDLKVLSEINKRMLEPRKPEAK